MRARPCERARVLLRPQRRGVRGASSEHGASVIIRGGSVFGSTRRLTGPQRARRSARADVRGVRSTEASGTTPTGAARRGEREGLRAGALDVRAHTGVKSATIYASAAVNASWRGDARADDLLAKINDPELARRARKVIDFAFVRAALDKKEAEGAVARARKGDLSPFERAWAYERAADILGTTNRARALSLLEEAAEEAPHRQQRPRPRPALTAVATRYEKLDRPRAWSSSPRRRARPTPRMPSPRGREDEGGVRTKGRVDHGLQRGGVRPCRRARRARRRQLGPRRAAAAKGSQSEAAPSPPSSPSAAAAL